MLAEKFSNKIEEIKKEKEKAKSLKKELEKELSLVNKMDKTIVDRFFPRNLKMEKYKSKYNNGNTWSNIMDYERSFWSGKISIGVYELNNGFLHNPIRTIKDYKTNRIWRMKEIKIDKTMTISDLRLYVSELKELEKDIENFDLENVCS